MVSHSKLILEKSAVGSFHETHHCFCFMILGLYNCFSIFLYTCVDGN